VEIFENPKNASRMFELIFPQQISVFRSLRKLKISFIFTFVLPENEIFRSTIEKSASKKQTFLEENIYFLKKIFRIKIIILRSYLLEIYF